ncbi:MAG: ABC transporter permease [Acidobacteria bacterium]|nr:ABC transporter permease [Acidobacteriota bacterium]
MNRLRTWFLAPAATVTVVLFLIPLTVILGYSAMTRGAYFGLGPPWTLANYARVFDPLYGAVLWRSFVLSAVSTALCLTLGLPLALFISRSGKRRNLYLNLVMLPFWTSFLVRIYAWIFLLRDTGLVNAFLQKLGVIHDPLPMLYNDGAVILGLVYGYLPFMVLPLYATLERLDPFLIEAAADLGARPATAFWKVTLPLCAPGIRAGAVLVFIPCLGAFLVPDLLGGGKSIMIGNVVQNQFTTARDWPFGAALSLVLMALVMLALLAALGRRSEDLL